ncbi:MAG: hypothetical protein C4K47_09905 [Candidatus Thorarchaeota archaeon]|nr:MAG: hypothetical protein C4K47_09905 [Candidatus Thorarchaeota archaeon]
MSADDIIEFCLKSESLKRLPRTGWILAGEDYSGCEKIASHCWGTSVIALLLALQLRFEGKSVDLERLLTMAILHDLPESIVSDIPYRAVELGGIAMKSAKKETERVAAKQILTPLGALGESLSKALEEFEGPDTLEAKIAVASDRLDMLAHAVSMENRGFPPQNLERFFEHVESEINSLHLDLAQELFSELFRLHKTRLGSPKKSR